MNFKTIAQKTWATIKRKSPEILTGLGISSMIGGTIAAVRATPEAMRRIEAKKKELHKKKLTMVETVQAVWKCYIPTAILSITGAGCMIAATAEGGKREAALIALNAFTENRLSEYQDAVRDTYGEKGNEKVHDRVAEREMEKNPPPKQTQNIEAYSANISNGEALYYLNFPMIPIDLRWVYCTEKDLNDAVNKCNRSMSTSFEPYISLYDFLSEIPGVSLDRLNECTAILSRVGWNLYRGFIKLGNPIPKHVPCMYLTTNTQGTTIANYVEFERDGAPDYDYQF